MKIVVSPNPYRDKQFKNARQACSILKDAGAEVALCLPFDVDKTFEIPSDLQFRDIQKEIRTADMLVCFGGDGTILHSSKIATEHNIPILGVNIGTMGFIAELEAAELELLRRIPRGEYTVEERTMLDVSVGNGRHTLFHETALNDAVITKGAIARELLRRRGGDQLLRRRRHPLHADRLDRLFHVRRRPDRGAVREEFSHYSYLRARHAGKEHCRRAQPCGDGQGW